MKASTHKNLGRIAGILRAINEGSANDPISHAYCYFPDPTPSMERVVRREGFANLHHFYAVLNQRTSARWTWMHMPLFAASLRGRRAERRKHHDLDR